MINLKNPFASINDPDPDTVRQLQFILKAVALSILGIAVALAVINRGRLGLGFYGALSIAVFSGVALVFSLRGAHWVGRILLPLFGLCGLTYLAINTDGLHDSTISAFTLPIIVFGLLAGQRVLPFATILTILAIWLVAYADISGINTSRFAVQTVLTDAIGIAAVLSFVQVIAAAALSALMSRMKTILAAARRSEMELLEKNRELVAIRETLEQKVIKRTEALETARAEAEFARREAERQAWYTLGQARLAEKMRGEPDLVTLADNVTSFLCRYTGAQAGALYLVEQDLLKLTGRYAYVEDVNRKPASHLHETLTGESARSRRQIKLDFPATAGMLVSSALGDAQPSQILITPLEADGEVYGVLELGTLDDFSHEHEEFLRRVSESVAVAIRTAQTRQQVNDLLSTSQARTAAQSAWRNLP